MGRGVEQVVRMFQDAGCRDLSLHLYPGARHELFHEQNRREVWADLLDWLEDRPAPSAHLTEERRTAKITKELYKEGFL